MRFLVIAFLAVLPLSVFAQENFDAVSLHVSRGSVNYEKDGETVITSTTLRMRDVTVSTCVKLAYQVQQSQIVGPRDMDQQHYDIEAKSGSPVSLQQMRAMMQHMLAERFGFDFHKASQELTANVLTVLPSGAKMKRSRSQDGDPAHQGSFRGIAAQNFSMQDFVTYMSGPLGTPLIDETRLSGRYDFVIDFRPYIDEAGDLRPDPQAVLKAAFQAELGLLMTRRHTTVDTMVIDRVSAPTPN